MSRAFLTSVAILLAGCTPAALADAREEAVARRFLAQVHGGDSRGAAALEPGGAIARAGYDTLVAMAARHLPPAPADSVRLEAWESVVDSLGAARRFTYLVYRDTLVSRADVWLVRRGDSAYVNTLNLQGPGLVAR